MKGWLLTLAIIAAGVVTVYVSRPVDHRDQCVVCKPSGKLAMWGECE